MKSVECSVVREGRLLLTRTATGSLAPLVADLREGESPIEAVTRLIGEHTGGHLSPSCAGIYFRLTPGHLTEHGLAFVAEAQTELQTLAAAEYLWLDPVGLEQQSDLPPVYRQLAARFLTADQPLAVVLTSDEPGPIEASRVEAISTIEPAVLSPLVFAAQS